MLKYCMICSFSILLSGCQILGSNDDNVMLLEVERKTVAVGDTLNLSLVNFSKNTHTVHPSLCGTVLQERQAAGWHSLIPPSNYTCTKIGLELRPGSRVQTVRVIEQNLPTGQYRFIYTIRLYERGGIDEVSSIEEIIIPSDAFEVIAGH